MYLYFSEKISLITFSFSNLQIFIKCELYINKMRQYLQLSTSMPLLRNSKTYQGLQISEKEPVTQQISIISREIVNKINILHGRNDIYLCSQILPQFQKTLVSILRLFFTNLHTFNLKKSTYRNYQFWISFLHW